MWTECVESAFGDAKQPFHVDTKDGLLIVKVKQVEPREWLVQEVCKYITKSDSWSKLPSIDLNEVALIRKWSRMFELFGSFRSIDDGLPDSDRPIVHTRSVKDGRSASTAMYWRDRIAGINLNDYRMELTEEYDRCIKGRMAQLMLRFHVRKVLTYSELIGFAGPDPPKDTTPRDEILRNLGL